jgi:hypothetical protein
MPPTGRGGDHVLPPLFIVAFVASSCAASDTVAPRPSRSAPKPYFGLLHAHTAFSDGSGTPEEAFASAKGAGLDFFAVTEHNHAAAESGAGERADGLLIATDHGLYSGQTPLTVVRKWTENGKNKTQTLSNVKSVITAAHDATSPSFVALYGQEFSTISSGNHVNIFEIDDVLAVPNGDFRDFFQKLSDSPGIPPPLPVVVQLNHPDIFADLFYAGNDPQKKKGMRNDYGIDDADFGPEFQNLVDHEDRFVHLIEVLSGPALSPGGAPKHYAALEDDYFFYLTQGLHLSPSAGQDNHYPTWGTITDARTGVYATELTAMGILSACAANRTFATEDKNLSVMLHLAANGATHAMGDAAVLTGDPELAFTVSVEDSDEPATEYTVDLYCGVIKPGNRDHLSPMRARDGLIGEKTRSGNGDVVFAGDHPSGQPEFYYARVTQHDGDRAWTAPIWINYPRTWAVDASSSTFVWSIHSSAHVYHSPDCSSVTHIAAENRRTGGSPPDGWTPHSCIDGSTNGH